MFKPSTLLSLSLLLLAAPTFAQSTKTPFYVSPHLSTQGFGIDLKVTPQPAFNIHAGASFLPVKFNSTYTVRSEPANADVKVDLANAHLIFDWHPFIKSASFAQKLLLSAGAAYFWKDKGDATVTYSGTYDYQGVPIPSGEVGELYGTVEWKKIAPYFGIGIENPLPKHRVNVGFALGAYYMGKPTATVTGTKYLSDTKSDEEEFRKNVSNYRVLPVVQVNLNVRL